jgi:pimeloyl-ACP methyl ester carboxylesterase
MLDLKGFGRSPKPRDGEYSIYDQAALVRRFIVERSLRGLTLVGHSFGGGVALATTVNLLEEDPGRLSALILIDSPAYRQHLPNFIRILRIPVVGIVGIHLLPPTLQVRQILKLAYFDDTKVSDEAVSAYAAPIREPGGRQALVTTAGQIIPANIDEFAEKYGSIKIPTLLLWGRHDEIIPLEIGRRLHREITHSEFVVVEGAGHIPQEEVPEKTIGILIDFLARTTSSKSLL